MQSHHDVSLEAGGFNHFVGEQALFPVSHADMHHADASHPRADATLAAICSSRMISMRSQDANAPPPLPRDATISRK